MRSTKQAGVLVSIVAIASALALGLGCGSSSSNADDPTALTQPIATGITINEIAIFQALKIPLAKDGEVADRGAIPLSVIAGRDAMLRIYVTPDAGFGAKPITARG